MRLETVWRFAVSLPATTEEPPYFEKSSFRVKGKIFATVPVGGKHLHVNVEADEGHALGGVPGRVRADRVGEAVADGLDPVTLAKADRAIVQGLLKTPGAG